MPARQNKTGPSLYGPVKEEKAKRFWDLWVLDYITYFPSHRFFVPQKPYLNITWGLPIGNHL